MPLQDRPPPPEPSRERTKGWRVIGIGLIVVAFVCYIAYGVFVALTGIAGEPPQTGLASPFLFLPILSVLGFIAGCGLLIAKVLVDRVLNREDNYYSKHIER